MSHRPSLVAATLACLPWALVAPAPAEESGAGWPGWRGPEAAGVSTATGLPDTWSDTENVVWKTPLPGRGVSSPIVWGDRIFLTADVEGDVVPGAAPPTHYRPSGEVYLHGDSTSGNRRHTLLLFALNADTGDVVWKRTLHDGPVYDDRHRKNSYASATPVTDGERIYSYFGAEGVFAHDFSGRLVWRSSIGTVAKAGLGPGTSPLLVGELLVLQCDQENGETSFLAAVDRRTGEVAWKTERRHRRSWATPLRVQSGGTDLVVASGRESVAAYDPVDGHVVWETRGLESNAIPSPVAGEGLVFISAGYPKKRTLALRPGPGVDESRRIAWQYDRGSGYVPSPIFYAGRLYLVDDKGMLTCLDAKTGAVIYKSRRVPNPGRFTASPIVYSGRLLLMSEDGDTYVISAGDRYEVLAANPMGEPIFASPAIAGGRLYIRTASQLFAIGR